MDFLNDPAFRAISEYVDSGDFERDQAADTGLVIDEDDEAVGDGELEAFEDEEAKDDDPQCVCGVYRSEHSAMGCPEGFQTPAQWAEEREQIRAQAFAEADDDYDRYDGDEDVDDSDPYGYGFDPFDYQHDGYDE